MICIFTSVFLMLYHLYSPTPGLNTLDPEFVYPTERAQYSHRLNTCNAIVNS